MEIAKNLLTQVKNVLLCVHLPSASATRVMLYIMEYRVLKVFP